jgi:predicted CXXCH cytochrome family protein
VRRLTLLLAGAALWLFLAALPALADGGPHVVSVNSGSGTGPGALTADSCAGCHRAHTAQGPMLINAPDEEALCLTCHGTTGGGATTSVVDGVQYATVGTDATAHTGVVAGALRGGGFVNARIDSTNPVRIPLPRWDNKGTATDLTDGDSYVASFSSRVPARTTGAPVTSAHLKLAAGPNSSTGTPALVELQGTAWGNGAVGTGVGAASVTLGCASCHNPHGNGQYRILNPVPDADGVTVTPSAGVKVAEVRDATAVTNGVRNYTVNRGASLSGIVAGSDDYWRRYQPYSTVPQVRSLFRADRRVSGFTDSGQTACTLNPDQNNADGVSDTSTAYVNCPVGYPSGYFAGDYPEFVAPGNPPGTSTAVGNWRKSLSAWCSTCHSRYNTEVMPSTDGTGAAVASYENPLVGEDIFKYRHPTTSSLECTKCHVAHGSNALMPGSTLGTNFSGTFDYPVAVGGTAVSNDSSRLLKVDNRGTCQQCHDPTGTVPAPLTPVYGP